ncbi:MAG TPA: hypothetical protein VFK73_05835, partial [Paludibacter sp.]|nr:hypothetical protein [Paludibacter sp.]
VISMENGTGANEDKLGAIEIRFIHNDKYYECNCGSGFSQDERVKYWNNPELLIDKIVTIRYFGVSKNDGGTYGLRFPTWTGRIRDDKSEISMY